MKKLFLALTILLLITGCSKDDDDKLQKVYEFDGTEIEGRVDDYLYSNYKIILGVDEPFRKDGFISSASRTCPNKIASHNDINNNSIWWGRSLDALDYYWHCTFCGANYDIHTGKARNEKAQGVTLQIYKISVKEGIWTVWK